MTELFVVEDEVISAFWTPDFIVFFKPGPFFIELMAAFSIIASERDVCARNIFKDLLALTL